MIPNYTEVPLQEFELKHPALKGARWFGKSAQWWQDIKFIEDAPKEKLDLLENNLYKFLDLISVHYNCLEMKSWIKDFEICGSWGFANQTWHSDLDIQMSCENEENQKKLMAIIRPQLHEYFLPQIGILSKFLKISTEIRFGEWKNKQYAECYSLRDRKLYNRTPHTNMSKDYHRYWDFPNYQYSISTRLMGRKSDGLFWDKYGNEQNRDSVKLKTHYVDINGVITSG